MTKRPAGRLVYSTGAGRVCPGCGWPAASCRCSAASKAIEPIPASPTARLRIEKQGRGGKTVTIVDGLPRNPGFLEGLAKEFKRACGAGGCVADGSIEIQGDQRERLRRMLAAKGIAVKG